MPYAITNNFTGFSNAQTMQAFAHLLFSTFKLEGGFEGTISPTLLRSIREHAEKWVFEAEKNIPRSKAEEMQSYLSMYDVMHSLAFSGNVSDSGFYDRQMSDAILKMAHGEKADKVMFMNWIHNRLRTDYSHVPENHFRWYMSVISRWEDEFRMGMRTFTRESDTDTLGIIDFLLRNALKDKRPNRLSTPMLLKSGISLTEKTLKDKDAGPRQLENAAMFSLTLYLADPAHSHRDMRKEILQRLSETPDIHPYARKGYWLDIRYEFPDNSPSSPAPVGRRPGSATSVAEFCPHFLSMEFIPLEKY